MQARLHREETINPAKCAWDNLLSLTFLLTLHFLQDLVAEFAVSSIIKTG